MKLTDLTWEDKGAMLRLQKEIAAHREFFAKHPEYEEVTK